MKSFLLKKHDANLAKARALAMAEIGAVSGGADNCFTFTWKPETNDPGFCFCDPCLPKPVQDPGEP